MNMRTAAAADAWTFASLCQRHSELQACARLRENTTAASQGKRRPLTRCDGDSRKQRPNTTALPCAWPTEVNSTVTHISSRCLNRR